MFVFRVIKVHLDELSFTEELILSWILKDRRIYLSLILWGIPSTWEAESKGWGVHSSLRYTGNRYLKPKVGDLWK